MEKKEFKEFVKSMGDYIVDYFENIRDRRVLSDVEPGYLRPLLPEEAPEQPEKWQDVMADIEKIIMPGVTHWHSPRFHAYYPTANSYPSIVADMLSDGIGCAAFSWIASPACTELEMVMTDWLGKLLHLPSEFLACSGGKGGGVIQGTLSEATLVALLGAKVRTLRELGVKQPDWFHNDIVRKLVAYTSEQAHSCVERAGLLGGVQMRLLATDSSFKLRGETLQKAIQEDRDKGLIPFYVVATLGTTSVCSFDALEEMGAVCSKEKIWLHVDAAYAGSAFICPEFRYLMKGVEVVDSFSFNPHKWMMVNFDCSVMWFKSYSDFVEGFRVDHLYLQHDRQGAVVDYRHWQIPMTRRFRALKLWFVLRLYGVNNIRVHIRKQVALAHEFESLVRQDDRFEIIADVIMGLVAFRLKGSNGRNEALLKRINDHGVIHLVPSKINDTYFLRLAICSRFTESADIQLSWREIRTLAERVLAEVEPGR